MLRLYDTALGKVAELEVRDPGRLSMYVCGPTVYDDPHVGHGRFTVTWDILRRYAIWSGLDVNFVSNVTDIEDKIIAKAAAEGRTTDEVSAHFEGVWWDTQDRLGVMRPNETPHATAYVEDMVELIGKLMEAGHAYVGGDGVYFAAESIDGYGLLARQPIDSLRAGARVEAGEEAGKRSPIDFVLWKFAKPGEPSWPSPWGDGRPGWHTECVVMSLDILGEGFDLHGGGLDLAFPHHENERAQAIGAGCRFAKRWVHSGMVTAEGGEKMSKSLGNTLSLLEILEAYDPRAFRLQVLQSHYRSPLEISGSSLTANAAGVERLDAFAREFAGARGGLADREALERFRARMDDDLDTPGAVALGFDLIREARAAQGEEAAAKAAAVFEIFEQALGLRLRDKVAEAPPEALAKAAERDRARAEKDWARADALRAELQSEGWIVEDGPDGTTIRQ
ncbi:MAG TPA: cysteine--tRNA ligase [Acidimicrobiales bacterium]|nr:cysteine--tRNA ligase [Acidimicrobiales bacterium]